VAVQPGASRAREYPLLAGAVFLALTGAWVITRGTALFAAQPEGRLTLVVVAVLLPLAPWLVALLFRNSLARLLTVVGGGMLILGTSSELSFWKFGYLAAAALAVGVAFLSLPKLAVTVPHRLTRNVLHFSLAFFVVVSLRLLVAILEGTDIELAVRDAAPYLLFALAPLLAIDAAASSTEHQLTIVFLLVGAVGTAAFTLEWVSKRSLADLPVEYLTLAGSAPTALFAYASARAILGRHRLRWTALAVVTLSAMLLTGNRSTLLALLAPLSIVLLSPQRVRMSFRLLLLVLALGVITPSIITRYGTALGIDPNVVVERLASVTDPSSLRSDPSILIRATQNETAYERFAMRPVLGAGPGIRFTFGHPITHERVDSGFTLDSPLVFPAKFGIVGVVALLLLIGGYASLFKKLRKAPNVAATALVGFAVVQLVRTIAIGSAIEDKGFTFGFLLLLALSLRAAPTVTRNTNQEPRRDSPE
jgi:hypothetical protein